MKTYYCKRLFGDINFSVEKVYMCSGFNISEGIDIPCKNENIDEYVKKLISWRTEIFNKAIRGQLPEQCFLCKFLKQKKFSVIDYLKKKINPFNKYKIKNIVVKSFRQCEYNCVYCLEKKYTQGKKTKVPEKSSYYDFKPILEALINNNLIDHDVNIEFQGGSISVLEEFDDILNIIEKFKVGSLLYHTNAYTYIPKISELAKTIPTSMCISIDSGCRETYQKIKTEDSFDRVLENIQKYIKSGIICTIKYIIVRNLNDNIEEIKKYCETVKSLKSYCSEDKEFFLMLECDFRDSLQENYKMPEHYLELYKYACTFCKNNNILFGCQDFIREMISEFI